MGYASPRQLTSPAQPKASVLAMGQPIADALPAGARTTFEWPRRRSPNTAGIGGCVYTGRGCRGLKLKFVWRRGASMKRIVKTLGRMSRVRRACMVSGWWATTAIALPAQTFTTLHSFDGTDGAGPEAALVQGTDGNLYGTTSGQSPFSDGFGTIFRITPSGTLTTLYNFCSQSGCTDGESPNGLVQATNGDFYGTAAGWRGQWSWDGLQNQPEWHADYAIQLLSPKRVHGRRVALRRATPGPQWGLLWNNSLRWGQRLLFRAWLRDGLQG
jgi:uncharacterized repeat protein (TIGR03803 family)